MKAEFWQGRKTFVTGATGLLGSWLVKKLLDRGANVICLIRDWVPSSSLILSGDIERINIVRGDLEDYFTVLRAINEYEIETVFHLGAQTIVGTAGRSVLSTFEANIPAMVMAAIILSKIHYKNLKNLAQDKTGPLAFKYCLYQAMVI